MWYILQLLGRSIYYITCLTVARNSRLSQVELEFEANVVSGRLIDSLELDKDYMYKHFSSETNRVIPLYFDHKIANEFGSYPFLYPKLMTETPSKDKIDKLSYYLRQKYSK